MDEYPEHGPLFTAIEVRQRATDGRIDDIQEDIREIKAALLRTEEQQRLMLHRIGDISSPEAIESAIRKLAALRLGGTLLKHTGKVLVVSSVLTVGIWWERVSIAAGRFFKWLIGGA